MQRVVVAMCLSEGQAGTVHAYVMPRNAPKVCQRITYSMPLLPLHQRIMQLDTARPFSQVDVTGDFSASDAHQWLAACLPSLPEHLGAGTSAVTVMFESGQLQTQLAVAYRDGSVQMASDNVCTLALLRNSLVRCAVELSSNVTAVGSCCTWYVLCTLPCCMAQLERGFSCQCPSWPPHVHTSVLCRQASEGTVRVRVLNSMQRRTFEHLVERVWPLLQQIRSAEHNHHLTQALQDVTSQARALFRRLTLCWHPFCSGLQCSDTMPSMQLFQTMWTKLLCPMLCSFGDRHGARCDT